LEKAWLKLNPVKLCDYLKMGDSDSDEDNKYLFSLIRTKIYQESEKLKQVKEAHSRGADINPTDEKSGMTLLQTAQIKGYPTIVKYLEDKISESGTSESIIVQVNETSSEVIESSKDNESQASTSVNICNVNENTLSKTNPNVTQNVTQHKDNENKDSTSAGQNPVPNVSESEAPNQNKDNTNPASTNAGKNPVPKSVNVPKDGSCLFWAVTLAFLFPVRNDLAEFKGRFKKLFDSECAGNKHKISNFNTNNLLTLLNPRMGHIMIG
jgi:hypothetical protein